MINSNISGKCWVTEILKNIAEETGAPFFIEPVYEYAGYIILNNKKFFFRSERLNINNAGSIETVKDKNYCHFFLKHFGYNIPVSQAFFGNTINANVIEQKTIDEGYDYALSLGWPVMLKPNNASKGRLVTKVYNKLEYYKVAKAILKLSQVFIVEKYYSGQDYRVIVFNNRFFAAYKRTPLTITGTGKKTIRTLINDAKRKLELSGNGKINTRDERINKKLRVLGKSKDQILKKGEKIAILEIANVSSGGHIEDVTKVIHPNFKNIAEKISYDFNLALCGIDIICQDITQPDPNYVILEINSAPSLKHYATIGNSQFRRTLSLYKRIFKYIKLKMKYG